MGDLGKIRFFTTFLCTIGNSIRKNDDFWRFFETLQNFDSFLKTNFLKFFSKKKSVHSPHLSWKISVFWNSQLKSFWHFLKKSRFFNFFIPMGKPWKRTTKKVIFDVFHISLKSIFDIIWVIWWDPVFLWMFCTIGKLVWINTKFCETMKCLKNHYPNSITNLIYFLKRKYHTNKLIKITIVNSKLVVLTTVNID